MKAVTSWSFRPYCLMHRQERGMSPYICRIEPSKCGFTFDFIDNSNTTVNYTLYYRKRGETVYTDTALDKMTASIGGLGDNCDYEFYVQNNTNKMNSSTRLVRTGFAPGKIVNYLHPEDNEYSFSGKYLCSPSLVKLKSGRLLASMDVYGCGAPQNLTLIYYSDDGGASWKYLTELFPCFWGKMFTRGDELYMLGTSTEYGDLLIGRSFDEGLTWGMPTVLFRGTTRGECGIHRAPMPIEISHGRIMTDIQYGAWERGIFCNAVISAAIDSDLLDASSWLCTPCWNPTEAALAGVPLSNGGAGGIEGCVITAPDGSIVDILRYIDKKFFILKYDSNAPEAPLVFDGYIDIPVTASKLDIVYDEASKLYFAIASYALDEPQTLRNLLSLLCSSDLKNWKLVKHLIDYRNAPKNEVGFQYVDFLIDGDDILYLTRTAFNNSHSHHDSNYSCFDRIKDFRKLI